MYTSIATCLFFSIFFIEDAHAYLDGGTGGMILQLLLGGAIGFGAVLKLYWYKVKSFFFKKFFKD
jgi:hypothetical protein